MVKLPFVIIFENSCLNWPIGRLIGRKFAGKLDSCQLSRCNANSRDQGYHKLPLPILSSPHIPGLRSHSSSLPAPVRGLLHGNTRSNRYMKHILDELNQPINEGRYFSSCLHSYLSGHTLESQPYKQASHSSSNYPLLSQFDRAPVEVLQYICPHPPSPSRYYSEFVQAQLYSQVSNTHQPFVIHLSPPYPRK